MLPAFMDDLDAVAIGVEDMRGVVARIVVQQGAGWTVVGRPTANARARTVPAS